MGIRGFAERVRETIGLREILVVLLLSATAVMTAWSGFQASKWGGAMSITFSQASTARLESSTLTTDAAIKRSSQLALGLEWLGAVRIGDTEHAAFLRARFPVEMKKAVNAWDANNRAGSPFSDYPEDYVQPELLAAARADERADALFRRALEYNSRGDSYTLLTVLFASVLFFTGIAERFQSARIKWIMLVIALLLFAGGFISLFFAPKLLG